MAEITLATNRGVGKIRVPVGVLDGELTTDRFRVGQGYNSTTGMQAMTNCVDYLDSGDLAQEDSSGQRVDYIFRSISDYMRLKKELNISAAASLGMGIFSGSASMEFEQSESHSRLDTFLLIGVRVLNPSRVLRQSFLSDAALKIMARGQTEFLERCGNCYVYGYQSGGELLGIVKYSAETREQASKLRVQVAAAAKGYGSGSFSMTQAMQSITEHVSKDFTLLRSGGVGDLPSPEDLIDASRAYPESLRNDKDARLLAYLTRTYDTVENLPHPSLNFKLIDEQARAIEEISQYIAQTYERQNDWLRIRDQKPLYRFESNADETIEAALEHIEAVRDALYQQLNRVQLTGAFELTPPALPTLPEEIVPDALPIVTVWQDAYYTGRSADLNASIAELAEVGLQDSVSSFKVRGKPGEYLVELFVGGTFAGPVMSVVSPAEIAQLGFPFHDELSSVRISRLL